MGKDQHPFEYLVKERPFLVLHLLCMIIAVVSFAQWLGLEGHWNWLIPVGIGIYVFIVLLSANPNIRWVVVFSGGNNLGTAIPLTKAKALQICRYEGALYMEQMNGLLKGRRKYVEGKNTNQNGS